MERTINLAVKVAPNPGKLNSLPAHPYSPETKFVADCSGSLITTSGLQFAMKFLQRMQHLAIERKINDYAKRLAAKGSQPEGVFWNSEANQINRFVTLLALINTATGTEPGTSNAGRPFSIAEIGCGYGALYRYLQQRNPPDRWRYHGVDINPAMIAACRQNFPNEVNQFKVADRPQHEVDFSVFSGTFNLTPVDDCEQWLAISCRGCGMPLSRRGMVSTPVCARGKDQQEDLLHQQTAFHRHGSPAFWPDDCGANQGCYDFSFLISREKGQCPLRHVG